MSIFNNFEVAFKDKSNYDLNRAYFLFKVISLPYISKLLISVVKLAISLKLPIEFFVKKTIYSHFCGGVSVEKSQNTIDKLWKSNIGTILDFSAEGKEKKADFDRVLNETLLSIRKAKELQSIPFAVFKTTGLVRFSLLEKISSGEKLNISENEERENFIKKFYKICEEASKNNVSVFVDAEESWIQNAIDDIVLKMMLKFNRKKTIIFNTIQLYRNDRINYLKKIIRTASQKKIKIGLKLVRGAYHEKEIERAKDKGYKIPVHTQKEETDKDFNEGLKICIKNLDIISLCAGTHNEESSQFLIDLMSKYKIKKNDNRVYFSQLLGMSDNISYNLSKQGYNVAKYVPYGPVRDLLPYLIRRAEENTSISGQMGRELKNIIFEKKRRKKH